MSSSKRTFNTDSLSRLYSLVGGLGVEGYDPIRDTEITSPPMYGRAELLDAYRGLWACRKVCDYLPQAMARGWGQIMIPSNERLQRDLQKQMKSLRRSYSSAQKLANLFGGATIIRFVDDKREFSEPIGDRFKEIQYSRVFNPWEVYPLIESGYENLEDPEFYTFSSFSEENITVKVHRDRVIRFRGASTDYETMKKNRGFEDSLLVPFIEPCLRYTSALIYVGASVKNFEFMVHKMENLFLQIESSEGQTAIAKRLQALYNAVSSIRGALIDKNEEDVAIVSRRFSGVSDIIEMLLNEMISASGLTRPQFLQEHPTGLAATGESERIAEADNIRAMQEEKWGENIEEDCKLFLKASGYARDDWNWEWTNLFQQNPLEEAETLLKLAQAKRFRTEPIKDIEEEKTKCELRDVPIVAQSYPVLGH